MKPEDVATEVDVWPDTYEPLRLFRLMDTQWRVGASGATGLDYGVLFSIMDRERLDRDEQDELFKAVRIMEESALKQMAVNRQVAAEASA
jgi:hypothetical protein